MIIGTDVVATAASFIPIPGVGPGVRAAISAGASTVGGITTFIEVGKGEGTTTDALVAAHTLPTRFFGFTYGISKWLPVIGGVANAGQLVYDIISQDP